jgi:hypothetical protein
MGLKALAEKIWAWEQQEFPVTRPRGCIDQEYRPAGLTIEEILTWADLHHAETGNWPDRHSGPVHDGSRELTWRIVDSSLEKGQRGLPGDSSLAQLLAEHRGLGPPLTLEQILTWADAHHAATRRWPALNSGTIRGADGETWAQIDAHLRIGGRGLNGGQSLLSVLEKHRDLRDWCHQGELTLAQILVWADAHRAASGTWPAPESGPVRDGPGGLTWSIIDTALTRGFRGLPGGWSLARLVAEHRQPRPPLTIQQILAWADAHRAASRRWPNPNSGPILGAPGETWAAIDSSLRVSSRGLGTTTSLYRLLREHRNNQTKEENPQLTLEQVLVWVDAYRAANGTWPVTGSGPVAGAPAGETWRKINQSLARGHRGLPPLGSLYDLLARFRAEPQREPAAH